MVARPEATNIKRRIRMHPTWHLIVNDSPRQLGTRNETMNLSYNLFVPALVAMLQGKFTSDSMTI